jgi:hypothetical protein
MDHAPSDHSDSTDPGSTDSDAIDAFIENWASSGGSERGNAQSFIRELCTDVLGVEPPGPASARVDENAYVFERRVDFTGGQSGSVGYIDCYKQGHFVLEAKQGANAPDETEADALGVASGARKQGTARRGTRTWQRAMKRAKEQAFRYARALPAKEGWPPFLVVVDVSHCIDLYADFARQGRAYTAFPDQGSFRVRLEELTDPAVRERLRKVFEAPLELDPARQSARVTRALAKRLGTLAEQLEGKGHDPDDVAPFLMRCLFTMFAEDVGLLPERSFTGLLEEYRGHLEAFPKALGHLWTTMDQGGFEPGLKKDVRRFNGQLFAGAETLPVSGPQLDIADAETLPVDPRLTPTDS